MKKRKSSFLKGISLLIFGVFLVTNLNIKIGQASSGILMTITRTPSASSIKVGDTFDVNYTITPKPISTSINNKTKDIMLVIDTSGSMDWNVNNNNSDGASRLDSVKSVAKTFVQKFTDPKVNIGLIDFSDDARLDIALSNTGYNTGRSALVSSINNLVAGGGTNIGNALRKAYYLLGNSSVNPDHEKYIILLTDGQPTSYYYNYISWSNYNEPNNSNNPYFMYTSYTGSRKSPNQSGNSYYLYSSATDPVNYSNAYYNYSDTDGYAFQNAMAIASDKIKPSGINSYVVGFGPESTSNNLNIATAAGGTYQKATDSSTLNNLYNQFYYNMNNPSSTVHFEEPVPSGLQFVSCQNSNIIYDSGKVTGNISVPYRIDPNNNAQYIADPINIKVTYKAATSGVTLNQSKVTFQANQGFVSLTPINFGNSSGETLYFDSNNDISVGTLNKPTIKIDTVSLTSVKATITYDANSIRNEYSTDNSTWSTYSSPITFTKNVNVYARSFDAWNREYDVGPVTINSIDTTPPDAPIITTPVQGLITNNDKPIISGTAEALSKVTVIINGVISAAVNADANGNWTYTPTSSLKEGNDNITANATDASGNVSVNSPLVNITIDKTAPAAPIITSPIQGSYIKDTKPVINGTAEPNSLVDLYVDGIKITEVIANANGAWTYQIITALSEGAHNISATATDAAGNTSSKSPLVNFTVDKTAPNAPLIVNPSQGAITNNTKPSISGTAEANSTISIYIDGVIVGSVQSDGSGNWSFTPVTSLIDGNHTITATATDLAGNTSVQSVATNVTIDTVNPTISQVSIKSNNANSSYAKVGDTITVTFTASEAGTPNVSIAGHNATVTKVSNNYTATYVMQSMDTEGVVQYVINFNDLAGNAANAMTSSSDGSSVTFYKTAPVLTLVSIKSDNPDPSYAKIGDTITISFTGGRSLLATPTVTIAGHTAAVTALPGSGNNYTATYKMQGTENEGVIPYTIDFYDIVGNKGNLVTGTTDGTCVTFDKTSPSVEINYSSNPAGVGPMTITATYSEPVKAGETPQISINQQGTNDLAYTNMTGSADRKVWTYNYTVNLADGTNYLDGEADVSISTVHDAASNTALNPTGNSFIISTVKPSALITLSSDIVKVGTLTITATYSTPVKNGEIPQISIDQPGTSDVIAANMTISGTDRKTWIYNYTVNTQDNSNYKDGVATINLISVHDISGNIVPATTKTFIIDTTAPTVILNSSPNPAKAGTVSITTTYSEPIKTGEIPHISIDQQGTQDITNVNMTPDSSDGSVWVYNYTANPDDGSAYKDGVATISLSSVTDEAGNVAYLPGSGTQFVIDTKAPMVTGITSNYSSPIKNGSRVTFTVVFSESMMNSPNINIDLKGTDEDVNSAVMTQGSDKKTWYYVWTVPSGHDGDINISVDGMDLAGNQYSHDPNDDLSLTIANLVIPSMSIEISNNDTNDRLTVAFNGSDSGNYSMQYKTSNDNGWIDVPSSGTMQFSTGTVVYTREVYTREKDQSKYYSSSSPGLRIDKMLTVNNISSLPKDKPFTITVYLGNSWSGDTVECDLLGTNMSKYVTVEKISNDASGNARFKVTAVKAGSLKGSLKFKIKNHDNINKSINIKTLPQNSKGIM